jgi:hypothetical protein
LLRVARPSSKSDAFSATLTHLAADRMASASFGAACEISHDADDAGTAASASPDRFGRLDHGSLLLLLGSPLSEQEAAGRLHDVVFPAAALPASDAIFVHARIL